jgi:hypothetical protein
LLAGGLLSGDVVFNLAFELLLGVVRRFEFSLAPGTMLVVVLGAKLNSNLLTTPRRSSKARLKTTSPLRRPPASKPPL